jgi:NAD(P)-dependent dehydrogenase (short-subunit alcohol dehydrogenase family)
MDSGLAGKAVIVTGGSRRIGRAIVELFSAEGADVIFLFRENTVAPGVIDTDTSQAIRDRAGEEVKSRILLRWFGTPIDVAYAIWFLASRYADYITGEVLHVNGGFKME